MVNENCKQKCTLLYSVPNRNSVNRTTDNGWKIVLKDFFLTLDTGEGTINDTTIRTDYAIAMIPLQQLCIDELWQIR